MPRSCKIQLRTLTSTNEPGHNRLILFYLLIAKGIESNPGPQIGSTRGNSSRRGSLRGRGCNGLGSGHGRRQDPIDDTFVETSVCDPAGLNNRVDRPIPYVEHPGHKVNSQLVLNRQ